MIVVSLADDLASLHDNAAVAVMERRLGGLLEAEIEVLVCLHFGDGWMFLAGFGMFVELLSEYLE